MRFTTATATNENPAPESAFSPGRAQLAFRHVVIFDRWDTCFLISGPYITYISDAVKEQLRPYAGKTIQIDATEITQLMNPGDGLVKSYVILGQAPDDPNDPITNEIEIESRSDFDGDNGLMLEVTVRNASRQTVRISPAEVGLTLLGINQGIPFSASDGKPVAWITRANLEPQGPDHTANASWSSTVDGKKTAYATYKAVQPCTFNPVELAGGQSVGCRVGLEVPAGEYQFLVGYGGGVHMWKSIVSNAISFNLDAAGVATVEP